MADRTTSDRANGERSSDDGRGDRARRPASRADSCPGATEAFVALGSNLGDGRANLQRALDRLESTSGLTITAVSRFYRTAPVGPDQPDFLNAVAGVTVRGTLRFLFETCQRIESAMGRPTERERWGPRVIDLDVLSFGEETSASSDLIVPHPRLAERRFVLEPWSELAPDLRVPGVEGTIEELRRRLIDRVEQRVTALPTETALPRDRGWR